MLDVVKEVGSYAGLAALLGVAFLALLQFSQGRDLRRLRDGAGGAPERAGGTEETTSDLAAERARELREIEKAREAERQAAELRETRRGRREAGLPELTLGERLRGRLRQPGYLLLAILAALLLAGGVAFAAISLLGDDGAGRGGRQAKAGSALKPNDIRVSVLNGTAVSGLAGRSGDDLEKAGYQLGAVTNTTSSFTASEVMFKRGHRPEAARVAAVLDIRKLRLMTAEILALTAGAPVAVIIGEDRAASAP